MKLSPDATISPEKVRDYLLAPRDEDDKSPFFARAGYTRAEWWRLVDDLREQIVPLDAAFSRRSEYGDYYTVGGALRGPNGRTLQVTTVWIVGGGDGVTRFVTAYPARRRRPRA